MRGLQTLGKIKNGVKPRILRGLILGGALAIAFAIWGILPDANNLDQVVSESPEFVVMPDVNLRQSSRDSELLPLVQVKDGFCPTAGPVPVSSQSLGRFKTVGIPVVPMFPVQFSEPVQIASGEARLMATPVGGNPESLGIVEESRLVYKNAFTNCDVVYQSTVHKTEEFLVVRDHPLGNDSELPASWSWDISLAASKIPLKPRLTCLNTIEFVDSVGDPKLRIDCPWGIDAKGNTLTGEDRLSYSVTQLSDSVARVTLKANLEDLSYPVTIDPSWASTGSMAVARYGHQAVLLTNGKVLVAGGSDGAANLTSSEIFDPAGNGGIGSWAATSNSMSTARGGHSLVRLADGRVLACGGMTNTAEIFDPSGGGGLGSWTSTGNCGAAVRTNFGALLLPSGKVLIAGGYTGSLPALTSVELFDPVANSGIGAWSAATSLSTGRLSDSLFLLPTGKVLMAGGANGQSFGPGRKSFLFDPTTNAGLGSWANADDRDFQGEYGPISQLQDGRVLYAGGWDGPVHKECEIFNHTTSLWERTGDMNFVRSHNLAVTLTNGKVLVVAGQGGPNVASASCELFDPTAGTWQNTAALSTARQSTSVTRLADGRVLVAGGGNSSYAPLSSAEIFTVEIIAIPQSKSTNQDTAVPITLQFASISGEVTFDITGPSNGILTGTPPTLTYTPNPGYFGPDSFDFTVTDATGTSAPATVSITVISTANQLPVADLNGSGGGQNISLGYLEDTGLLTIVASDATVTDGDDTSLVSATVTLAERPNGTDETLAANVGATGISVSYEPGSGVLSLTGSASVAAYEQVLRTVSYINTAQAPTESDREVEFIFFDGEDFSAPAISTITVSGRNDAPILDNSGSPKLNSILKNAFSNPGTLVSDLIASAGGDRITDVDLLPQEGIAVIAADTSNGIWQFSTNGAAFQSFSALSNTSATLLCSDTDSRVRFVPNDGFFGLVSSGLTYRAWDRTDGKSDGQIGVNVSSNGGITPYSANAETASISVNSALVVTTRNDSGSGSLRECMTAATNGATITFDDVVFNPNNSAEATSIRPETQLPPLSSGNVTIDARNHRVILDGRFLSNNVSGIRVTSNGNKLFGLTVINFPRSGIVFASGATENNIGGDRSVGLGINGEGVRLTANLLSGLEITEAAAQNVVEGCWIGVAEDGESPQNRVPTNQRQQTGIIINGGANRNIIGSRIPTRANLIGFNLENGIDISGVGTVKNKIIGNTLGARAPAGSQVGAQANAEGASSRSVLTDVGNGLAGVHFNAGTQENVLGSDNDDVDDESEGNLIAFNGRSGQGIDQGFGVIVTDSDTSMNAVRRNSTSANRLGGIRIGGGGNAGILPPVILGATPNGPPSNGVANFQVFGSASGKAGSVVELFSTSTFSEGERFLGKVIVGGGDDWAGSFDIAVGAKLSATITDGDGNTSGYSFFDPGIPGGGGALVSEDEVYISKSSFQVNWKSHFSGAKKDTFKMVGNLNRAGMPVVLPPGASFRVALNGSDLCGGPIPLDGNGKGGGANDTGVFSAKVASKKGGFSFSLKSSDLRPNFSGSIENETEVGFVVIGLEVEVLGAGLDTPLIAAKPEYGFSTTQDVSSKGSYSFKKGRLASGIFYSSKISVAEEDIGGYRIASKGFIVPSGGAHWFLQVILQFRSVMRMQ